MCGVQGVKHQTPVIMSKSCPLALNTEVTLLMQRPVDARN